MDAVFAVALALVLFDLATLGFGAGIRGADRGDRR